MNIIQTPHNRITIIETDGAIDPLKLFDPVALADLVVPTRRRDLLLTPREYEGRSVLAVYDRPSDTLYVKVDP